MPNIDISLSQLVAAGVHFGHKTQRWNPKMFPYIYDEINNIHILDLVQSVKLLKKSKFIFRKFSESRLYIFICWY